MEQVGDGQVHPESRAPSFHPSIFNALEDDKDTKHACVPSGGVCVGRGYPVGRPSHMGLDGNPEPK